MAGLARPAMRRTAIVGSIGLIVTVMLVFFVPWGMAVVAGWDAAALVFLISVWPIILRASSSHAAQLATREDETRGSATVLLLAASVASLLGVGFALILAGQESGTLKVLLVSFAVLTVVLSWTVVNTVFTLRYADQHFGSGTAGIAFGDADGPETPHVPRFRLRRVHDRHVLPGVRHYGARSADPAYGSLSRPSFVRVRRGDRGGIRQPYRRPASLIRRQPTPPPARAARDRGRSSTSTSRSRARPRVGTARGGARSRRFHERSSAVMALVRCSWRDLCGFLGSGHNADARLRKSAGGCGSRSEAMSHRVEPKPDSPAGILRL